jgi:drug/metabolite transporter (DMT)-like permease
MVSLGLFFWTSTQQMIAFVFACLLAAAYHYSSGRFGYRPPQLGTVNAKLQVLLLAACFALNMGLNNFSLSLISITVNNMIRAASPFMTALCGSLFFSKRMPFEDWCFLCLGVAFSLVSALAGSPAATSHGHSTYALGVVVCFISLLGGALMFLIVETLGTSAVKLNAVDSMFYMSLPTGLLISSCMFAMPHVVDDKWAGGTFAGQKLTDVQLLGKITDVKLWLLMVLSGVFASSYNVIQFFTVQKLSSAQTAFASNLAKAVTVCIDRFVIHQFQNNLQNLVLVGSASSGIVCFMLFSHMRANRSSEPIDSDAMRTRHITNSVKVIVFTFLAGIMFGLMISPEPAQSPHHRAV